jgi:signal peptidase I
MWKFIILLLLAIAAVSSVFFGVLKVEGESMNPVLEDGNFVIIRKYVFHRYEPREGDILVFNSPLSGRLNIKRCSAVYGSTVFLTGTNLPESTDSRHFGRIKKTDIKGSVWIKI